MTEKRSRFSKDNIDPELKDVTAWATVDPELLVGRSRSRYKRLEKAIRDYFDERPVEFICKRGNISRQGLIRLVKRCLKIHPDGRIWGFRALISNRRQKSYERISPVNTKKIRTFGGRSGELNQLFDKYPVIRDYVESLFFKGGNAAIVHEPKIGYKSIHKRFIERCRQEKVPINAYPFTAGNLGYVALWRYLKKLEKRDVRRAADARYSKEAARTLKSGIKLNAEQKESITRPLQRVEFDGHLIDAFCTIQIPTVEGGYIEKVLDRIWLLLLIDVYSRAAIGYHLSLEKEYSAEDVLMCIKNSIVPKKRRGLTIPGLEYNEKGGFPSEVLQEFKWGLWDEISYDNAKANLALHVQEKLTSIVNCSINAGPVATPERRPIVERFFQTLEGNGYHRLPSTAGSGIKDSRRDDPEGKALKFSITLEHLEELTDVLISDYNGRSHKGIGYRSPLELLHYSVNSNMIMPRQLPKNQRKDLRIFNMKVTRKVCGNMETGRRPHINFEGERYTNEVLARTPDLIGKQLTLSVDISDIRSVTAYLPNGEELGSLTAQGPWGKTPHSLKMRKEVMKLKRKGLLEYNDRSDPIHVYIDHLQEVSIKNKRARSKLAGALKKNFKAQTTAPENPAISTIPKTLQARPEAGNSNSVKKKPEFQLKTITY